MLILSSVILIPSKVNVLIVFAVRDSPIFTVFLSNLIDLLVNISHLVAVIAKHLPLSMMLGVLEGNIDDVWLVFSSFLH